eukprot:44338-Amphidinium_carterae.1
MVAELALETIDKRAEREIENTSRTMMITSREKQTMVIYETQNNTIGMLQNMSIKLPTSTKFDRRHPQFYEWAGELKLYLSIHNLNIEDVMDDSTRSVTVVVLADIQTDYAAEDTKSLNDKFQVAPQEGENNYKELNIRKMRDEIVNFRQTLRTMCCYIRQNLGVKLKRKN